MVIAISGASGFIGSYLSDYLRDQGHAIVPLARDMFSPTRKDELKQAIGRCDAVINLAGAPIDRRWTQSYRQKLYESRLATTRSLVEAVNSCEKKPAVFISASAVGYYPPEGCHKEDSQTQGKGLLADLCSRWEAEAGKINPGVRLCITRFGVVLSDKGGALAKIVKPARMGIVPIIGSGRQNFSWISRHDLARAMEFTLKDDHIAGVVNFTAPQKISNSEFAKALARHYRSFACVRIPVFALRLLMGSSAQVVTQGQCAVPEKLLKAGFVFYDPSIEDFFKRM